MRVRSLLLVLAACTPTRPGAPAGPAPATPALAEPVPSDMPDETAPKAQPAQPEQPALAPLQAGAGARVVLDVRAMDVVALPGRVVALDPDFMHLRGFDALGAELWRTAVQDQPRGVHTLYALGERALLHAGPTLVSVDATDGKLVGRVDAWTNDGRCRLRLVDGLDERWREHVPWDSQKVACAYDCECSLQLLDCATMARLQLFNSSVSHVYRSLSEPHDNVCWKPPRLLGRVKGRTLAAIEDKHDYRLAALAAGATAWEDARLGRALGRFSDFGGDAGRDVCWALPENELVVWTCSTGKLRWRARLEPLDGHVVERTRLVGDRLIGERRSDERADIEARALATGKRLWRRSLAPDRALLFAGERPATWRDGAVTYLRIDPATGATLAELPVAKGDHLLVDPAGGWVRVGAAWTELDADLRPRREVAKDMSHTTWLDEHFVVQATAERVTVLRRPALDTALAAAGQYAVVESSGALGSGALLLREHRKGEALRVVLLRAGP